jgi:hypothetical protein
MTSTVDGMMYVISDDDTSYTTAACPVGSSWDLYLVAKGKTLDDVKQAAQGADCVVAYLGRGVV